MTTWRAEELKTVTVEAMYAIKLEDVDQISVMMIENAVES